MNEMTNDKSLSSEDLGKGNKKVIKNELPATELRTEDFFYELPEELIAQHPMEKRDASRLMVLNLSLIHIWWYRLHVSVSFGI